jgi:hypothetical protein
VDVGFRPGVDLGLAAQLLRSKATIEMKVRWRATLNIGLPCAGD